MNEEAVTPTTIQTEPKPTLSLQERLTVAVATLIARIEDWQKNDYHAIKKSELKVFRSLIKEARKPPKKQKPKSRNDRWSNAASDAVAALEELRGVQEEFEEWKDNLPENLQNSALGEKLEEVCNFDIENALETVQEADGADLPLGFGRD